MLTVDAVIREERKVALIKRKNPPFEGAWALPGGFVEYGETVEDAVKREAREETGLEVEIEKLVGVYSDPERDPRGHMISVVYLCEMISGKLHADTDAQEAKWFSIKCLPELAFDHEKIVRESFLCP